MDDEKILQFIGITASSADVARQYLNITDGSLDHAVQLYFEGGLDIQDQPSNTQTSTPQPAAGHSQTYEDDNGVIHVDSENEFTSNTSNPENSGYHPLRSRTTGDLHHGTDTPVSQGHPSVEDDEAMARRLQEEMYRGMDMAEGSSDGIRAPIARTTETLVGPDADEMGFRAGHPTQMHPRERGRRGRPGIFNQSIWADDTLDQEVRRERISLATGGESESSSKSSMLAEMYRPPFEIMSSLSWDDAREEGKTDEKWLLINVQDPSIFDCQVLNRDIWKDNEIKATVKENFIFMQYTKDDPRASQYIQYYFQSKDCQDAYPHISILDPRTGEQMKTWSGPPVPKPTEFLMQLHEFLDRYSLKANAKNPIARRKPDMPKEKQVERMTEEEMMELALKNSLAEHVEQPSGSSASRTGDPDELTRRSEEDKSTSSEEETDIKPPKAAVHTAPSTFSRISSANPHFEPPADPVNTTRIQFRHSGGRVIRRFALRDPVRRIYEWLKATPLESKAGAEFELVFMGKNLISLLNESIEQAGLKNGTIMVEFLE